METFGQLKQDFLALQYLKFKKNGYFVDIGANDGKTLSNTYMLERDYNWNGICVEPLTIEYNKCKDIRKCICVNTCIYDKNGEIEFSNIENEFNMYSGIKEDINHHKNVVDYHSSVVKMPCITFTKLLDDNNAPNIMDFLSLDTEGSELKILKSLDHKKYKFRYITLEHNYKEPNRTYIRNLLKVKGYFYMGQNKWDDIYSLENYHNNKKNITYSIKDAIN